MRSPVEERGRSWRKTSRSSGAGTSFSIPTTVMSVSGRVVQKRPLPSDSTTQTVPVSATAKLAPLIATRARRNRSRRWSRAASASSLGSSERSGRPSRSRKRSRISTRFLWMAGTRMCEEPSSASWQISSARSVSTTSIPAAARASFRRISSVVSDLTFTTSRSPVACTSPATTRQASSASRAQCTWPPARSTACSNWRR